MKPTTELTAKQRRFVAEYLLDLNATQAAKRAGYSNRTANEQGARLLANVSVQAAVHQGLAKINSGLEVSTKRVTTELACIGFANMLDYVTVDDAGDMRPSFRGLTRDQAAAIQEVTVEEYRDGRGVDAKRVRRTRIKLADKKGALELLARRLSMFRDDADEKDLTKKSDDELRAEIDQKLERLGMRLVPR
jgi:phage terminase small subunit